MLTPEREAEIRNIAKTIALYNDREFQDPVAELLEEIDRLREKVDLTVRWFEGYRESYENGRSPNSSCENPAIAMIKMLKENIRT